MVSKLTVLALIRQMLRGFVTRPLIASRVLVLIARNLHRLPLKKFVRLVHGRPV